MDGVLIIQKPAGMTSHDVVDGVRHILHERSVGHLGTLDPIATGVLPLVIGKMTRLSQFYNACEKTYEGDIRFGFATDTYDAEGKPTTPEREASITLDEVRRAAQRFQGVIEQVPPPFSAKKIHGVPAYKLARKDKHIDLKPAKVEIKEFTILSAKGRVARFRARVASGTYIRSVAHELGRDLQVGAHLAALTRTAFGEFTLQQAVTLDQLAEAMEAGSADQFFVHPRMLLPDFPAVTATEEDAGKIAHGRAVNLPELSRARLVKVFRGQSELIAIASRVVGTLFQPKVVLGG